MSELSHFYALTLDFNKEGLLAEMIQRSNLRHDFFIFVLMVEGYGVLKINLKEFRIEKNHLLIIPPDATKEITELSDNAVIKVIAYTSTFLIPLNLPENFWEMTDYFSAKNLPVWPLKNADAKLLIGLMDLMEAQEKSMNQHLYGQEILNHQFMIFMLELGALSRSYAQLELPKYSRKEILTIDFHALIKKHFRHHRNLAYYADLLFVTPKYLTETIKEVSGKTAGAALDSYTAQEARILLQSTSKSVAEISNELNFSDQSAFGKFFKRMEGISPSQYRSAKRT